MIESESEPTLFELTSADSVARESGNNDGVPMLFAAGVRAALFVLVLALAKIGRGPNVHLLDGWVGATQLVNNRILIIYQNVIVSL